MRPIFSRQALCRSRVRRPKSPMTYKRKEKADNGEQYVPQALIIGVGIQHVMMKQYAIHGPLGPGAKSPMHPFLFLGSGVDGRMGC